MSIKTINAAIAKVNSHCELIKGEGYHYFLYDNGTEIATESVMVMYTSHLSESDWVSEAKDFINKIGELTCESF